jgi:farnesyl-diphosphate farnesyltransferase
MPSREPGILTDLLKQVSRSFYLTLRVLPAPVRAQISLAYLLARATDTIADTRLVSTERRLSALRGVCSAVLEAAEGKPGCTPELGELAAAQVELTSQGSPGERVLLESLGKVLALLSGFQAEDRHLICNLLQIIIRGQESDLIHFGSATPEVPAALETDAELDEYTYSVAGCVGEFWTRICRTHLFPQAALDDEILLRRGVRFGKGLQLLNILRDLPRDLRQGRCYVPAARLAGQGLRPGDLLDAANMPRLRPLYDRYLDDAASNLAAGWAYTTSLPHFQVRVRLACAWPALIGVRTIACLRSANVLDCRQRLKVSRPELWRLVLRTLLLYPFPSSWAGLFKLAGR